jgi:hypothetical protein
MVKFLWTQKSDFGPGPRESHAIAFNSNRRRTVLFGGSGAGRKIGRYVGAGRVVLDPDGRYWSGTASRQPWSTTASGKSASFSEAVGPHTPRLQRLGGHMGVGWAGLDPARKLRSESVQLPCDGVRQRQKSDRAIWRRSAAARHGDLGVRRPGLDSLNAQSTRRSLSIKKIGDAIATSKPVASIEASASARS